jgi:glyceraldehyde 3-phosphate dehydrogenase
MSNAAQGGTKTRIAVHGFGRIGRQTFKTIWEDHDSLEIAAIGIERQGDARSAAHLLKYDSNYGQFAADVGIDGDHLVVDGKRIPLVWADSLAALPWVEHGIEIVIEATGAYVAASDAAGHLEAGARSVVIAAPSEDADFTMIYGVNEESYDPALHRIVSAGSDTTNALAPVVRVLEEAFDIKDALMTAVHAYTNEQKLLDAPDDDLRRARSAPTSIVPTSTRAAKAIRTVYPEFVGHIDGYAVRVPVPAVSILQLTANLHNVATAEEINDAFRKAAEGPLGRVMSVSDEPLVSTDYRGCCESAVIDALSTLTNGPLVKVSAWYDNERGYACRVADVTATIAAGGASKGKS